MTSPPPLLSIGPLYAGYVEKRPSINCKSPYVADVLINGNSHLGHAPCLGCEGMCDNGSEVLCCKIEKQGNSFLDSKSTYTEDLINTVKITKQKNIDENISFQMMMNCIPGISSKVSSRLSNKYKNMKEFLDTLNSIENDELRMDFIQNIKLETNGKSRKISKNVAENIIKFIGYHSE